MPRTAGRSCDASDGCHTPAAWFSTWLLRRLPHSRRRQYGLVTHAQALTVMTIASCSTRLAGRAARARPPRRVPGRRCAGELAPVRAGGVSRPTACVRCRSRRPRLCGAFPGLIRRASRSQCHGFNRARLDDVHRAREHGVGRHSHGEVRARIPVTSVARTLCDLSVVLGPGQLGRDRRRRAAAQARHDASVRSAVSRARGQRPSPVYDDTTGAERARSRLSTGRQRSREAHRASCSYGRWPSAGQSSDTVCGSGSKSIRLDIAYVDARFGFEYDSYGVPREPSPRSRAIANATSNSS